MKFFTKKKLVSATDKYASLYFYTSFKDTKDTQTWQNDMYVPYIVSSNVCTLWEKTCDRLNAEAMFLPPNQGHHNALRN